MRRFVFALSCALAVGAFLSGCGNPAGGASPTPEPTASPAPVNHPPVVNAGADFSIDVTQTARLSATATDEDGDALSYSWSFVSPLVFASALTDASIGARTSAAASFQPDRAGQYSLDVSVSDGTAIVTDRIVVTAAFGGAAPVAKAMANVSFCAPGETVGFSGYGSDPDHSSLTYALAFQSQPAGSSLAFAEDASSYPPGAYMDDQPLALTVAGTYVVRMSATDPEGHVGTDDVTVVVAAQNSSGGNTAPFAEAGDDIAIVQEMVPPVTISGSASLDLDGDTLAGTWECISAPAAYAGDLTFINGMLAPLPPLDIGFPRDCFAAGQYVMQLTVDDGQGYGENGDGGKNQASIARDTMTVTVRDASPILLDFSLNTNQVDLDDTGVNARFVDAHAAILDADLALGAGNTASFSLQAPAGSHSELSTPVITPVEPNFLTEIYSDFVADLPGTYTITLTITEGGVATIWRLQVKAYSPSAQGGVNVGIE